jgi:putative hydrolase of the HAD superfamily
LSDGSFRVFQAVIWDFGGVFTSSPFEAFARYERERGLPENLIRQINSANPLENAWAKFERSELDLDQFDVEFAKEANALGHHVPGKDIIALLSGDFRPDVIEALRRIKRADYKTGCITNNVPANTSDSREGRSLYAREIMEMFDHLIESSKIGIRKPNPRIYEMMCETLSVPPEHCVYLDDLGMNLKPAKAMGMATIKVESGPQAVRELEKLLDMKLG